MENFEKNLNDQPKEVTPADIAEAKKAGETKLYQIPGSTMLVSEEEYNAWRKEQLEAGTNLNIE
ncbi:MAG: hypothetical protein EOM85_04735 [Candidatus Moranbacteria bacterium]|nr:hypothetical protein [Candidatus Moranbacteria bacterium]